MQNLQRVGIVRDHETQQLRPLVDMAELQWIRAILTSCATCCQPSRTPGSVPKPDQNEKALINTCPSNPQKGADVDVNA